MPLIGMLLAAGSVALFGLQAYGIKVVGEIPAGLPALGIPALPWSDVASLAAPAVGIAVVAYSDNILTARAFATRNGYSIDHNQEMVALGVSNLAAARRPGRRRVRPETGRPPHLHDLPTAVEAYAEWYARRHGERPPGVSR